MGANKLTADLLLAIQERFPQVWLYRNNRVDAMAVGAGGRERRVSAGINGQGDLSGAVTVRVGTPTGYMDIGVRIEIEIKAGRDAMRIGQISFGKKITSMGGFYLVARSVDQALRDINVFLSQFSAEIEK